MDKGHYKTTGAFMLMDPYTGRIITEQGPTEGDEPFVKNHFLAEKLEAGHLEELALFAEGEDAPAWTATKPKKAAAKTAEA